MRQVGFGSVALAVALLVLTLWWMQRESGRHGRTRDEAGSAMDRPEGSLLASRPSSDEAMHASVATESRPVRVLVPPVESKPAAPSHSAEAVFLHKHLDFLASVRNAMSRPAEVPSDVEFLAKESALGTPRIQPDDPRIPELKRIAAEYDPLVDRARAEARAELERAWHDAVDKCQFRVRTLQEAMGGPPETSTFESRQKLADEDHRAFETQMNARYGKHYEDWRYLETTDPQTRSSYRIVVHIGAQPAAFAAARAEDAVRAMRDERIRKLFEPR